MRPNEKCPHCNAVERIGEFCNTCGKNLEDINSPTHLIRMNYKPKTIIITRIRGNKIAGKTVGISASGRVAYIYG